MSLKIATAIMRVHRQLGEIGPLASEVHEAAYTPGRSGPMMERVNTGKAGSRPPGQGDRSAKSAYLAAYADLVRGYRGLSQIARKNKADIVLWSPHVGMPSPRQFVRGASHTAMALIQMSMVDPKAMVQVTERGTIVQGPLLYLDKCYETLHRAAVSPQGLIEEAEDDFQAQLDAQMHRWRSGDR